MCLVADFKIHNFKGIIEIIEIEMETKAFKLRGIHIKRFLSSLCFNKVSSWGDYMLPPHPSKKDICNDFLISLFKQLRCVLLYIITFILYRFWSIEKSPSRIIRPNQKLVQILTK